MTARPFRFGVVAGVAETGDEWIEKARAVESMGYATLVMPDRMKYTLAPLPALAAAAAGTRSLRVGTYVVNNDFRNPVLLAKEAATLDLLSNGRFELGMGAGLPAAAEDNSMLGVPFDAGGVRVQRLAESLTLIKSLLSGQTTTAPGPYYAASNAEISPRPAQQPRPPILVAGAGRRMLELAARQADIVALGIPPTATGEVVAEKIGWLRNAASERFDRLELNVNLMAVGDKVPRYVAAQMGLSAETLARSGAFSAVTGTPDEMCEALLVRRETLGISYFMVGDELMEEFAPVVERLTGR